jgi:hypothetical protein
LAKCITNFLNNSLKLENLKKFRPSYLKGTRLNHKTLQKPTKVFKHQKTAGQRELNKMILLKPRTIKHT